MTSIVVSSGDVQGGLFGTNNSSARTERYEIAGPDIVYLPGYLDANRSVAWFRSLHADLPWRQETLTMYGDIVPVPRLSSWHGDAQRAYTYSNIEMHPLAWTPLLLDIKAVVEPIAGCSFNSVLCNLYRDGSDSVAWHADDERELGLTPTIASVSLGVTRKFQLRSNVKPVIRHDLDVAHGSVLIMRGESQRTWMHQVPKTKARVGPRINLTFRTIYEVACPE